jgi:selenocysteine-specific elongation factor
MKHLILGTAGHVDHGKTALIKALTDIDCDTHKEEKDRGITINLGFSHLTLPTGESLGIVDVPGHKDFIRTMVAGAFGIDIVLLVVAADSGIMPQTIEHIKIIEMLGVKKGIVVLNKADLVDDEMLELAQLEIDEFLENTALRNTPVIPVSSVTGKGIDELIAEISKTVPEIAEKKDSGQFRMYIDRIFNVKGIGFVVTGSVLNGEVEIGHDLYLLPGKNKKVKVRNIQRHGNAVDKVITGDRAALNLAGLKMDDYQRGMVLSDKVMDDTQMIDTTFTLFAENHQIGLWSKVIFYSGTFECAARMHLLDQDTLEAGQTAIVQLHLEKPVCLLNKDKYVIRNSSNDATLGGGDVIDVKPLHHKKRTKKLIDSLNDLVGATLESDKLINLIKIELRKENTPVFPELIGEKLGIPVEDIIHESRENGEGTICILREGKSTILVSNELHGYYQDTVIDFLKVYHQKNAILDEGVETTAFYGKFGFGRNEAGKLYLEALMNIFQNEGTVKRVGNTWTLTDHKVKIDPNTQEQLKWVEDLILNVGMDKPVEQDIAAAAMDHKINKERLKMFLKYLGKKNSLTFHGGEFLHTNILNKCRDLLLHDLKNKERGINEKDFRLLIDGTKKMVQFVLSIFIAEGIVTKPTFYILLTDKGKELANT